MHSVTTRRTVCARLRVALLMSLSLSAAALPLRVFAQDAAKSDATADGPSNPDERSTVKLSPFVVDSSKDTRYRAANSMAGSRLDTSLENISNAIDIYTKDFMDDLAATNLEETLEYANNRETDSGDTADGTGTDQISDHVSYTFRIRGLAASRALDYFDYNYPIDTYDVSRLDEARGPNAILFGFGSPGGIVNVTTNKAAVNRSFGSLSYSTGSEMQNREVLDYNHVLLPDKLALRLTGLHQEKEGWRQYTYDNRDAIHGALTFQPTSRTRILLEGESFLLHDEHSRGGNTYWSETTTWDAAGQPLIYGAWGDRNNQSKNPGLDTSVLARVSNKNYWVLNSNDGSVANWNMMTLSNIASVTAPDGTKVTRYADLRSMQTTPDGILYVNTMGPSMGSRASINRLSGTFQQQLTDKLNLEVAALKSHSYWHALRTSPQRLYGDPNAYLPVGGNGSTGPSKTNPVDNPYAGMYYMDAQYGLEYWKRWETNQDVRATLSYDLDLGKTWGHHRMAALVERDEYEIFEQTLGEYLLVNGQLASGNPADGQNSLWRRQYITDPNDPSQYHLPYVDIAHPFNTILSDGTKLQSTWLQNRSSPPDYKKTDDTIMFVIQSAWLKDRLHTTIGVRRDKANFADHGDYVSDGNGSYVRDPAAYSDVPFTATTKTLGAVYKINGWLSALANYSTSVGIPALKTTYAPTGEFMGTTRGVGHDYGVKFSFFNGRLAGGLSYYDAATDKETYWGNIAGWGVNGNNNFVNALADAGFITQAEADSRQAHGIGDTYDTQTHGLEFNLSGRISSGWDVRFNASYTKKRGSNALPRLHAWAQDTLRPYWNSWDKPNPNGGGSILDTVYSGSSTLRDIIDNFEAQLEDSTIFVEQVRGTRPYKSNLFTRYAFEDGRLKGTSVGVGLRYDSANIVGQDANGDDIKGNSHFSMDAMLRYDHKVFGRPFSFQLNVTNLTQSDPEVTPAYVNAVGTYGAIIVFPPRQWTFTVRTKF